MDVEQTNFWFCFRMISQSKCYTLQGESAIDHTDWIEKITRVNDSLMYFQMMEHNLPCSPINSGHQCTSSERITLGNSCDFD